jgi:arylsulfatase A-like enzyme
MLHRRAARPIGYLLLAAGPLALGACGGTDDAPRPNVILISVDTLRPDFLGCYGHPRPTSPAIDALAARGTVFDDVTAAAPWTLPSHATMLTGLYPSRHGVIDHTYRLEAETLQQSLSSAGYQTMAVVNSHNIGDRAYGLIDGFDAGKAEYVPEMEELFGGPIVNRGNAITNKAIAALNARDEARPFFLFLHYYDVHTDFTPDPKWKLEFVRAESRLKGTTDELTRLRARGVELAESDLQWLREMYEAEIRTLDEILARLFDHLEASGLAKNTLIALTSDHGEEFYEHRGLLHGRTHYQELVRIPLILAGPGVPRGEHIETPVHGVDVAPTIWALAGVAAPEGVDGVDLSVAWTDPSAMPARKLYSEADHNNLVAGKDVPNIKRMVRDGEEKLLYDTVSKRKELYDLAEDPGETRDLAQAEPERAEALWQELEGFMAGARTGRFTGPVDAERQRDIDATGYGGTEQAAQDPAPARSPEAPPADGAGAVIDDAPGDARGMALDALRAAAAEVAQRAEASVNRVDVQHLLVSFKGAPRVDPQPQRTLEEAEVLAAELFARAKAGEDFDALVKQYTNDAYPGVYSITRRRRETLAPAFGDTAWRLEVGELGVAAYDPGTSPFGWHLIKRTK